MGLYETIENLQNKSEGARRRILLLLLVISFVLLVSLWVFTIKKQVVNQNGSLFGVVPDNQKGTSDKNKQSNSGLLEPLASLKEGLSVVISDIKNATVEALSSNEEVLQQEGEIEQPEESSGALRLPISE